MEKFGLPTAGIVHGGKSDADAARVVDRFLRRGDHLIQVGALGGPRAADLPHQHFAGDAAPLVRSLFGAEGTSSLATTVLTVRPSPTPV